ncbi:SusC/RagA family TonB-linked outer membrane protein [Rhizosphaericola mali]|uniref:SusC/RagA family TonB-linked outer membrane protein n=1 Tax=Rhizosphaericola mali TaxID=2545455 RepID=A0A5P2G4D9_9BACT|nr:SusC/RagA family TonB-linked outer membrane protein [Rhizosphaericola mali]QES90385.1 SusC/RagA family TonB-linked outer membrane protein [Rhizosphaericola mali]
MKKKIFKASSFLSLVLAMSTMTTQAQQVDSTATNAKDSTKKVDKVMDEVVVVAYGSQRVKNLTGSMATVGGAKLADKPFSSVDKALQGQVAGLQVTSGSGAAGSSTDIRLRGIGSISASSSPLWVIDGVIASSGDWSSNTTSQNVLSSLNPDDIASITVLKDAAATAIYGSRAANGVIIVTTKKGQAGTTKVDFVGQWGGNSRAFYNQNNRPMTTPEYMKAFDMALQNAGYSNSYASSADIMVNDFDMDTTVNTNWYNLVNRTGNQAQYNLSLSGGNEKTQFYASSGYFTQDASTINSNFKRYNGSINVHHKASDRLTLDIGLNGAYSKQQTPLNGGAFGNPNLASYFVPSWYSPYKSDGSLNYGTDEFPTGGGVFNPLVIAAYDKYTSSQFTMRGFVSGKYQILNNLSFTSKFSSEYFDLNEYQYNNPLYGDGYSFGGDAYAYDTKVFNYTWTNLFNYKLNLNSAKDINLDITAGQEAYKHNYNIMTASGKVMPQNLEKQDLTVAGVPTAATTGKSYNAMNSYLANAVFNIKDRYVISGSFRRDGSSVFGANHRWGNFFSVGGSWNINNEDFMKNISWLNVLKLRGSYGENGNAIGFGDYSSVKYYTYGSNYNNQAGMVISNVGNPDLTWEKNKIFDIGLDWAFFENRLSGSIDYYNRATSNLLISVPLSYTTGYTSGELMNVGSMRNRGLEFTINGTPIKTKDFSWDVSFNISHNNNKVTKLYNGNPISNGQFRITEGHNIQEYYLREWAGVDKTNGNALWYTNGADTATTSNISNAGYSLTGKTAMPKYFGGFTNTFTYKNFSLTAVFNYNFGNYVEDSWASYYNSDGTYYGSFQQSNLQLQAWTPENTNTNVPKLVYGNSSSSRSMSTRFLYKGNYIRLRTLQFDYRLPKSVLDKFKLTNVDFFFSATNWWTFATDKNIPFDPESGVNATTNLNVPINKTITGGIKIGL